MHAHTATGSQIPGIWGSGERAVGAWRLGQVPCRAQSSPGASNSSAEHFVNSRAKFCISWTLRLVAACGVWQRWREHPCHATLSTSILALLALARFLGEPLRNHIQFRQGSVLLLLCACSYVLEITHLKKKKSAWCVYLPHDLVFHLTATFHVQQPAICRQIFLRWTVRLKRRNAPFSEKLLSSHRW